MENNNEHDDDGGGGEQEAQAEQHIAQQRQRQRKQERQRKFKKVISILEKHGKFPVQNRNSIDELVDRFLEQVGNSVHDLLCSNDADADNYRGLDSDRDTEAEVETAVRFFPEVLSRKKHFPLYPIHLLSFQHEEDDDGDTFWGCNVKAVSFIPVVARLAIEFGLSFDGEEKRGGLLCGGINGVWKYLLGSYTSAKTDHEAIDEKYLQVLIQLRKIGLLKKEDMRMYDLLKQLLYHPYFAERRLQFLVQWDPTALIRLDANGESPLYYAAYGSSTIRAFQLVFEAGVRYYPKKTGINLLFTKTDYGSTPFRSACGYFGRDEVMEVVEDTLIRCYSSSDDTPSLNIEDALILAAIDRYIHLDCVYFLLRREPDILQKLLSSSSSSSSITTNSTETIVTKINPKKRKRKDTKKNDHDHDGT